MDGITPQNKELVEFSNRLNAALDKCGYPPKNYGRQVLLGKYFGVSQRAARKWLEGENMPHLKRMKKMTELLLSYGVRVSVDWLLTGDETNKPDWYGQ